MSSSIDMAKNSIRPRAHPVELALLVVAAGAVAFRLWTSFCFFPLAEWNNVRLAPTFMLAFGSTPYPGLAGGPVTTWIYGPVPLLLNLPAIWAHDTVGALFTAEVINLLLTIVPAAWAVLAVASAEKGASRADGAWAVLFCLALWPNTSLQYLQSDNAAVAFGLIANVLLLRARDGRGSRLAFAGLCTGLAIWSKQVSIGLIPAQLLWLALAVDRRAVVRYALLCGAFNLALAAGFSAWFGFDRLWLNLVRIPGRLPFCDDLLARTIDFWPHLAGYVLLPAAGLFVGRRVIWKRDSRWLLPVLTWLCLLPTALVSVYRIGGATNSLNGFLYLLPIAAVTVVAAFRQSVPHAASAWLAAGILAVLTQQLASSPLVPLRPLTAQLLEAGQLARAFPGRIYFPWHPLVTFFSERRFYHAEDGLRTRRLAGLGLGSAVSRLDLPPRWSVTALPGWRDEGVFKELQPPGARLGFFGKWTVYTWPSSPTGTGSDPPAAQ